MPYVISPKINDDTYIFVSVYPIKSWIKRDVTTKNLRRRDFETSGVEILTGMISSEGSYEYSCKAVHEEKIVN